MNKDPMIEIEKRKFLEYLNIDSERAGLVSSLQAALQRNPTYLTDTTETQRKCFRNSFAEMIRNQSQKYVAGFKEDEDLKVIDSIKTELTREYRRILRGNQLRVGTVQKAFNLYLKIMWSLDSKQPSPPHCPIDRIVLKRAGIIDAWTKLNSMNKYSDWIKKCDEVRKKEKERSIAEWELKLWNSYRSG